MFNYIYFEEVFVIQQSAKFLKCYKNIPTQLFSIPPQQVLLLSTRLLALPWRRVINWKKLKTIRGNISCKSLCGKLHELWACERSKTYTSLACWNIWNLKMSSVMAREEPLIKQLARSRALVGGGSRPSRYAHNVNFKCGEKGVARNRVWGGPLEFPSG